MNKRASNKCIKLIVYINKLNLAIARKKGR